MELNIVDINVFCSTFTNVFVRGVDPYGTGGTRPRNIWTGGHYHECPPQNFWSNISYFLSMQYFLDKLKEFSEFSEKKKYFFQPHVIF